MTYLVNYIRNYSSVDAYLNDMLQETLDEIRIAWGDEFVEDDENLIYEMRPLVRDTISEVDADHLDVVFTTDRARKFYVVDAAAWEERLDIWYNNAEKK